MGVIVVTVNVVTDNDVNDNDEAVSVVTFKLVKKPFPNLFVEVPIVAVDAPPIILATYKFVHHVDEEPRLYEFPIGTTPAD